MTFGQILDRIFHVLRAHWKPMTAIGMLPMGFLLVFEGAFFGMFYLAGVFKTPPAPPNTALLLSTVGLYYGASTYASVQVDSGVNVTAAEALRHAWSRIGRYTWLLLLRGLIISIPIFAIAAIALVGGLLMGLVTKGNLSSNASSGALFLLIPLAVLLYLGAIVYAVIMTLRTSLAFPACVHENLTAGQAIKRSGVLTQGAKGRIFLALLVIYAISYAVLLVMYAVGFFVVAIAMAVGAGNMQHLSPLTIAMLAVAGLVFLGVFLLWTALLMAGYSTAYAVFYRDQRLRKDGPPPAPAPIAAV
jgi:MFS family permease